MKNDVMGIDRKEVLNSQESFEIQQPDSRSRGQKMLEASLTKSFEEKLVSDNKQVNAWLDNNEKVAASVYEDSVVIPDMAKHENLNQKNTCRGLNKYSTYSFSESHSSVFSKDYEPPVKSYKRQANSKRAYDKKQACYFCKKLVSKCTRHLKSVHASEIDLISLSRKTKKQQKIEYERLRVLGNFNHNVRVLREKVGQLIVVRRSVLLKQCSDYLPCIHCFGFFAQEQLWRHVRVCKHRRVQEDEEIDEKEFSSVKSQSMMLLEGAGLHFNQATSKDNYTELNENIIDRMRHDDITSVVASDDIIRTFGNGLLEKKGKEKRHEIGQRMRQVARLLIEIRKVIKRKVDLSSCLSGKFFDTVVCATRQLCVVQNELTIGGVKMLEKPSLGVHLGHSLLKCCAVKRGMSLRTNSLEALTEASAFAELMGIEWHNKVSSGALQTLKERKYDKVEVLPLTSDLMLLRDYISKALLCAKVEFENNPSDASWRRLADLVFVAVTLFNKRRGGEVAKMTLKAFTKRPPWRDIHNVEFKRTLTALELKLLERYTIVQLQLIMIHLVCYHVGHFT
jgi:hypothetical protein